MSETPCANCQHPASQHSQMAGCYAETPGANSGYCTCATFQRPAAQPPTVVDGLAEGRRLRDEGVALIDSADGEAEDAWRVEAASALDTLIAGGREFSADDLVAIAGEPPRPNMLGGLFLGASRQDRIQAVGFHQSARPSAHARIQRTWKAA